MAEFHGKQGTMTIGVDTGTVYDPIVVSLRGWTVQSKTDVVKTMIMNTSTAQKNKGAYGGHTEYSGTFEGYIGTGSKVSFTLMHGSTTTIVLATGDGQTYTGACILASLSLENKADDVGQLSGSFEIDGAFA